MRLDRFLSNHFAKGRSKTRRLLASGSVVVDDVVVTDPHCPVTQFTKISVNGELIRNETPIYLILNKPAGYLSATTDPVHPTVMDLIPGDLRSVLHIAGRLDRASTGLLILTNDGIWSRNLTEPKEGIPKTYLVQTARPISPSSIDTFANGIYFAYEDLTTQPAVLEILDSRKARVTIHEGRYHQIKRMFHATGNKVIDLHRTRIGEIELPRDLEPGRYHFFSPDP